MNKFILLLLFCGVNGASFSQEHNDYKEGIFKSLETYTTNPLYVLTVNSDNQPYRLFVNDIPLMSSAISGKLTFYANIAIQSSGKQKIQVKELSGNKTKKSGSLSAQVSANNAQQNGEMKKVLLWSYDNSKDKISKGEFAAEVPYNLTGWSNSQDIKHIDADKMKLALDWYKQIHQNLVKHQGTQFMNALLSAEQLSFQANYISAQQAERQHEGWKNYLNIGGYQVDDITQARLEIVGGGKLIHLITENGESAISINSAGKNRRTIFDIFLHFSEGSTSPEPIMLHMKEVSVD